MRSLTQPEAASPRRLCTARFPLFSPNSSATTILDVIEQYVTERDAGPALVELEGRHYTMHPAVGGVH